MGNIVPDRNSIADPYLAETVREEAVGGTAPTPDQDSADILGAAVGYELEDEAELGLKDRLDNIDEHRPELNLDF
ncbi:DUF6335 family protein [Merismopedia glauca]|uniref:Uncharacterized protein n=1 Tax=Merismopedia glauca CCAP 1448/3 TaxID=1296344 RepID=A0A2T1BYI0_9CYAN|nr:DUF6335 family protein [Merismopedia glauca]PSB00933.1 hypothetical protein C7B64_20935 [Merismopedia glauca CCAP 1448/3]